MAGPAHAPDRATTAAGVMVTHPKTLAPDVRVGEVRAAFEDDHVVMLLITEGRRLVGTLLREDVPADAAPSDPALPLARLEGRTVSPAEDVDALHRRLLDEGARRLAVVSDAGELLGLVCLKRRLDGFCDDAGVSARAQDRAGWSGSARPTADRPAP